MLTFEKVLEIFEDYLAQDMELEVYKSRYGYVCVRCAKQKKKQIISYRDEMGS